MIYLSRAKLLRLQLVKLTQLILNMFGDLGFDKFLHLTSKAKLLKVFGEVFELCAKVTNPTGGGKKSLFYGALCLLEEINVTWRELHKALVDFMERMLKEILCISQEKNNLKDGAYSRVHKVQGELLVKNGQLQELQEQFAQQRARILELE